MLVIREAQWAIFEEHAREFFVQRCRMEMEKRHPRECEQLGPARLARRVREAVAVAAHYRITEESDVTEFVEMTFERQDAFWLAPWVQRVLTLDMPGDRKMALLQIAAARQDEEAIVRSGGRRAG